MLVNSHWVLKEVQEKCTDDRLQHEVTDEQVLLSKSCVRGKVQLGVGILATRQKV